MFEFPPFSIWSLWIIFVPLFAFIWIVMEAGNRRRGVRIENKEDHVNAKVSTISMMPILAWLVMSIFTPIVVGPLFWVGCALIIIAGIIYVSAIEAFVRAGCRIIRTTARIRSYVLASRPDNGASNSGHIAMGYNYNPLDGTWRRAIPQRKIWRCVS